MELQNMKETAEADSSVPCPIATPVELVRGNRSADQFNFVELQNKFKTICADYGCDLEPNYRSKAVEFCSTMLYKVAPESRKLDRNVDRTWKFSFPNDNCTICPTLCVSTFRKSEFSDCFVSGKLLFCTVRQASLLAMDTCIKLGRMAYNNNKSIILTPLAGATFSKIDIPKIANELNRPVVEVIEVINSSCQPDGQYLALSEAAPALVASELGTSGLRDRRVAASIITKTLKQYKAHGKEVDPNDYKTYSKYAFSVLPGDLAAWAIQRYEEIRLSTVRSSASGTSSREEQVRQQPRDTAVAAEEELQYGGTVDDDGELPDDLNPSHLSQIFEDISLSTTRQATSKILRPSASGTASGEDQVRLQTRNTAEAAEEELDVQYEDTVYETTLDDHGSSDYA